MTAFYGKIAKQTRICFVIIYKEKLKDEGEGGRGGFLPGIK